MVHFEVCLPVLYFLFLKERRDIGHLDVGIFGVQILGVYLFQHIMGRERAVSREVLLKERWGTLYPPSWASWAAPLREERPITSCESWVNRKPRE